MRPSLRLSAGTIGRKSARIARAGMRTFGVNLAFDKRSRMFKGDSSPRRGMQPSPPVPAYAPPAPRSRLVPLLAIGAVILLAVGGVVGYLIGNSAVAQATLRVNVENRF